MIRRLSGINYTFLAYLLLIIAGFVLTSRPLSAASGVNAQLNLQGRLADQNGAIVADGTYNMRFKIYQDGDGVLGGGDETLKWTEEWKQTNRVTVKNGYFSVNLNAICASWTGGCASNGGIDWNQDTLWLSLDIGGTTNTASPTYDGEMTPFKRLTSTPYALNSDKLQGLAASAFAQLTSNNALTGTNNITNASLNAFTIAASGSNYGLQVDESSSGASNGLEIKAGSSGAGLSLTTISPATNDSLTIDAKGTGTLTLQSSATGNIGFFGTSYGITSAGALTVSSCSGCGGGGSTLQQAYAAGSTITTATTGTAADIGITLSDSTGTDANFITSILSGSSGKFAVQYNGTDYLAINSSGISINTTANYNNSSITGIDSLSISDPGPGEGLHFNSTTAGWNVDVTPLDRSNADGNLNLYGTANNIALWRPGLFVYDSTHYATLSTDSSGNFTIAPNTGTIHFFTSSNVLTSSGNLTLAAGLTIGDTNAVTVGGTSGTTLNCTGSQVVTAPTFKGGIITGGSCGSSSPTLQQAYDASTSPAAITTSSGSKVIKIIAGAAQTADLMTVDAYNGSLTATTTGVAALHIISPKTSGSINYYGINIDGPPSQAGGDTDTAVRVTTGWDIGLDLGSGGIQMANLSSDPATPASGNIRVYSKLVAGRTMLKTLGSSGVNYALQPSLFQQNVVLITGGAGTSSSTYTTVGSNVTASGTLATTSGSTSEALGDTSRIATSTTSGTVAGFFTKNVYYRGTGGNNADGYFYFARMNLNGQALSNYNTATGSRLYFGMCGTTYNNCVSSDSPTTSHAAGFQYSGSRADTNFQFITCNGSACNAINTGVTVNNTDTFDLYVYNAPGASTTYWRIDDMTSGAAPVEGSSSTDLPGASTALNAGLQIINLSAANHYLYFQRMYFETDR